MKQFEMNFQRHENGKWESREFETPEEAKKSAEFWAKFCYNCNWQGTQPGQDNAPAWTMRDGTKK